MIEVSAYHGGLMFGISIILLGVIPKIYYGNTWNVWTQVVYPLGLMFGIIFTGAILIFTNVRFV